MAHPGNLNSFTQGYVEALLRALPRPDGHKPTMPMRRALMALAASSDGRLAISDFYRALGVTNRGRHLVYHRMQDRHWVEPCGTGAAHVEILPWGRTALRPFGFSDLAPETLARIMEDCERYITHAKRKEHDQRFFRDNAGLGEVFWAVRQTDKAVWAYVFRPLTPYLGEDGKVYLREGA